MTAGAVHQTVESPALTPLAQAILPVVLEETKTNLSLKQLSEACRYSMCLDHVPRSCAIPVPSCAIPVNLVDYLLTMCTTCQPRA